MEKFNKHYLKLEIPTILDKLKDYVTTLSVKEEVESLVPSSDIDYLNMELDDVTEVLEIINRFEKLFIDIDLDFDEIIYRAHIGGVLGPIELYQVIKLQSSIDSAYKILNNVEKEKLPLNNFINLVNSFIDINVLVNNIKKAIDYDGQILDSASPTLKTIRTKLRGMDAKIKSKLNEIKNNLSSKLSESLIVVRDNRYCLPVKAEYKNTVKGIVHDTSSSMQTFYIEPYAVVELSLEKDKLINEEVEEINRILKGLSKEVANYYEVLVENFKVIKRLDMLFGKASLAKEMDAVKPILTYDHKLNLIKARHPLLKVKKVIPNDISFGNKYQGIIITGPNTGGKTVLLKTVGLLSLMTKYGLLIPCNEGSVMTIYDDVYCDIGDDQSITSNLSTFSSHLSKIIDILNHVTYRSLVLFDEIGSGTDPIEGSSLAIAILSYLLDHNISFITTTHYSKLKIFGFNEPRVINASMEFDDKSLTPTYKLLLGITGASNAFNIAKLLGLKKEIIEHAEKLLDESNDESRLMVGKIEETSSMLQELERNLNLQLEENRILKDELLKEKTKFNNEKERLMKNAYEEANKIIEKARFDSKQLIDEIEVLKEKNPKLHEVADIKHKVNTLDTHKKVIKGDKNHVYHLGDDVYVPKYEQYGNVEKINGNKITVSLGNMRMEFKKEDIVYVNPYEVKKSYEVTTKVKNNNSGIKKSEKSVKMTLDLRGMRYEEAKDALLQYIDDLILTGLKQANIIHGFGTGAIRNLVQDTVKKNPNISSSRYGGEGEGGFGVTVITLK